MDGLGEGVEELSPQDEETRNTDRPPRLPRTWEGGRTWTLSLGLLASEPGAITRWLDALRQGGRARAQGEAREGPAADGASTPSGWFTERAPVPQKPRKNSSFQRHTAQETPRRASRSSGLLGHLVEDSVLPRPLQPGGGTLKQRYSGRRR